MLQLIALSFSELQMLKKKKAISENNLLISGVSVGVHHFKGA